MLCRHFALILILAILSCNGDGSRLEPAAAAHPYGVDLAASRAALRRLTQETLARPRRSLRLFVEGYFLRSLVAAHETLSEDGDQSLRAADSLNTFAGIQRAIVFADGLVRLQGSDGYWYIGYDTVWLADIAAALPVFRVLEAYVDTTRARRYKDATQRFVAAARRDDFILESGAVALGWPKSRKTDQRWHPEVGDVGQPYVVSTALVGVELQAWLHRQTGDPIYRRGAIAALDYTLEQIGADGTLSSPARGEGPLFVAAYVQEGWMAADILLDDPEVLGRLRRELPRHVDWLLRTQREDGTWDEGDLPAFARTPAIVNFLIWYDQRCESREDVRAAIRRASLFLSTPLLWKQRLAPALGIDVEVFYALLGRPLVALVAGRPVL